jgi:hypothetical protein
MGHAKAHRILLNCLEKKAYKAIPKAPTEGETTVAPKKTSDAPPKKKAWKAPHVNPSCTRLNLYPLLQEKEKGATGELFCKMVTTFYGENLLKGFPGGAPKFCQEFVKVIRKEEALKGEVALQALKFADPEQQMLYYRMMKGTKKADVLTGEGYPSLLEYVKIKRLKSYLCLYHAHPNLIAALFSVKSAAKIYEKLHETKEGLPMFDAIEKICAESKDVPIPAELISLARLTRSVCKGKEREIIIAHDPTSQVTLKQAVLRAF